MGLTTLRIFDFTDKQGLEVMIRYKKNVAHYAVALLTVCSVVQLLGVETSYAQDTRVRKKFNDRILVVQPKPILQRNRVEIVPTFRVSLNDAVVRNFSVGATLNYHILESLYVGLGFDWSNFGKSLGGFTPFAKELNMLVGVRPDGIKLQYVGFAEIGYVPIMGKLAIFNSAIGYYDLAITLGGGYLAYNNILSAETNRTGGGMIGVNARFFLADWFALTASMRDLIFVAKFEGSEDKQLTNVVSAGIGFSIYIPFGFEYSQSELKGVNSLNLASDSSGDE